VGALIHTRRLQLLYRIPRTCQRDSSAAADAGPCEVSDAVLRESGAALSALACGKAEKLINYLKTRSIELELTTTEGKALLGNLRGALTMNGLILNPASSSDLEQLCDATRRSRGVVVSSQELVSEHRRRLSIGCTAWSDALIAKRDIEAALVTSSIAFAVAARDAKAAGWSASDAKAVGLIGSARDTKAAGYSALDVREAGLIGSARDAKAAGYPPLARATHGDGGPRSPLTGAPSP